MAKRARRMAFRLEYRDMRNTQTYANGYADGICTTTSLSACFLGLAAGL